jgi:hypothetical protein
MLTKRSTRLLIGSLVSTAIDLAITHAFWHRSASADPLTAMPAAARSDAALAADKVFWATFHGGHYADIQSALDVMTAAYLQTPRDAITASHVAWLHMWRVGERAQNPAAPATITDDIVLAHKIDRAIAMRR